MNFSLFPIPLLSPPPSQREGGGNYRFPIPLLTSPFPKGRGRKLLYFLPLLWRGRCRRGRYLDFYPIPLLNPPPSQGGDVLFLFPSKGKGEIKGNPPSPKFSRSENFGGGKNRSIFVHTCLVPFVVRGGQKWSGCYNPIFAKSKRKRELSFWK